MNPALKFILKSIEEGAVVIEQTVKRSEGFHAIKGNFQTDAVHRVTESFDHLHQSLRAVKTIVEELIL